ncbi:MAG: polyunsaturated fatty acid synthase PfaA [Ruminococcaceae bacterium]|nr:polyunsaturated fatty acid synthase PfaA [Oscillospiraceae bacterium]
MMQQKATVDRILTDGKAEVLVVRESACSGDCHKCSGCGSVKQTLRVTAQNLISAQRGDIVYIRSESAVVLKAAALVYLLPIVAFLAAYLAAMPLGVWAAVIACSAFVLGMLPAFAYNRRIKNRPPTYSIVGYVR